MSISIYNVDKPFPYESLVAVEVTSDFLFWLQDEPNDSGYGIESTNPEFLARFRKVKHDGAISSERNLQSILIHKGDLILIQPDGIVNVVPLPIDESYFWRASRKAPETIFKYPLDADAFSAVRLTLEEFNDLLDSYKVEKPKPIKNNKIYLGDFVSDYDDDALLEEL